MKSEEMSSIQLRSNTISGSVSSRANNNNQYTPRLLCIIMENHKNLWKRNQVNEWRRVKRNDNVISKFLIIPKQTADASIFLSPFILAPLIYSAAAHHPASASASDFICYNEQCLFTLQPLQTRIGQQQCTHQYCVVPKHRHQQYLFHRK